MLSFLMIVSFIMTSTTNITRPGVIASRRLAKIRDVKIWAAIEQQYDSMIEKKGGVKLRQLDETREALGEKLRSEKNPSISLDELFQVVEWKFAKGKPRHALWKHLKSIQQKDIDDFSKESFHKANSGDVKGAIEILAKLSGVGPATASAVLSIYRPDVFTFMDDEVIEALNEDKKRGYTVSIYLEVNSKCQEIAGTLGWSCNRVGRALWTASQILAMGGEDLTISAKGNDSELSSSSTTRKHKRPPKEENDAPFGSAVTKIRKK